jgi:tetratricopeptide (TPR) repeat protein
MIGMLETRLRADPKDRSTQHDLGAVMERAGADLIGLNPVKALAYTKRAMELRDASDDNRGEKAGPRIRLAEAHIALRQHGDAARRLEEAAGLVAAGDHETERDIYRGWARLEWARGNLTQAADWFDKAAAAGEAALKEKPVPVNALLLARALELGAQVRPDTAAARRHRILEVWQDQNQRFPSAYLQRRVAEAERNQLAQ